MAPAPARITTSDGVDLAVHDLGGDGPPLLMAHATGFHGQVFAPLARLLAPFFHCWSFDFRGHGDSAGPPGGDFAWAGFGRDVIGVVDGVGLVRPFSVGHSAGGAGLLIAELDRPGTFRAMYAYEPIVFPPGPGPSAQASGAQPNRGHLLAASARRRREVFASRAEALANFAAKPPLADLDPLALEAYVAHGFEDLPDGSVRLKCRREDEARVYEMAGQHGTYDRLGQIRCPVTLACGARTESLGEDAMRAAAQRMPAARVDVLEGLGHFGPMQDPAAVAAGVHHAFGGS
ncbi:MAG TPA: alpha/beta hydrolase [Acidimicrobiales bacterium]